MRAFGVYLPGGVEGLRPASVRMLLCEPRCYCTVYVMCLNVDAVVDEFLAHS